MNYTKIHLDSKTNISMKYKCICKFYILPYILERNFKYQKSLIIIFINTYDDDDKIQSSHSS